MNQEVKAKWVAALRSGRYKQGIQTLQNAKNQFCCLGVLCDIYSKENNQQIFWVRKGHYGNYEFIDGNEREVDFLPNVVKDWAGCDSYLPAVEFENEKLSLAFLNDIKKLSFEQIADLIEEQL